jgi:hypothetical protein
MKNKWVLTLGILLVCGLTLIGCDNGTTSVKIIAPEYRGKWELVSINSQPLPYLFDGTLISSSGYEIGDTYVTRYINGVVYQKGEGMYSDGNVLYDSSGYGYTMQLTGTNATVITTQAVYSLKKVSEFSWDSGIAPEYRGKWQMVSVKFPSESSFHTLPFIFNGTLISSGGYDIGDTYVTMYVNKYVYRKWEGMHSEGNVLYDSSGYGYIMQLTGTNATVTTAEEVYSLKKVSQFSWE